MEIDEMVAQLAAWLQSMRVGAQLHTSGNLSDNPSVCHAACKYFLHHVGNSGGAQAIAQLGLLDKTTLKAYQATIAGELQMHRQVRDNVNASLATAAAASRAEEDEGVRDELYQKAKALSDALDMIWNHVALPADNEYSTVVPTVVERIVTGLDASASANGATGGIIFMKPPTGFFASLFGSSTGHVMCFKVTPQGIMLLYDPNIGVIEIPHVLTGAWREALTRILNWYSEFGGLKRFAYKLR